MYFIDSNIEEKDHQGIWFSVFLCDNSSPHFDSKDDAYGFPSPRTFSGNQPRKDTTRTSLATTQILHGDPSSKIWGLYLSQAEKIDKEHSESWTANTDGVLVFVRRNSSHQIILFLPRRPDQTGLFSAVVGAFLIVSYPLLQPNSTDTTNQLLTQISQQLSTSGTGSQPLPPANTSFRPPSSAVRVNVLWFTSLAMSTACALWATLMQQWTRRYIQVADRPYGPPKRARIRAFFADGVEKFGLAAAVEVLPGLLHTSVLLFYVGLIDFLLTINHTVAFCLLASVVLGCLTYLMLTIMPLFYPNSPYQTPLSSLCWFFLEATPLLGFWVRRRKDDIRKRRIKIGQGMRRALESKATRLESPDSNATPFDEKVTPPDSNVTPLDSNPTPKAKTPKRKATSLHEQQAHADTNALRWTLTSLDEDHELEEFLDGLPGLFRGSSPDLSRELKRRLERSVKPVAEKLFATCTTGILPDALRRQRLTACLGAIWCFSGTINLHFRAIWNQWGKLTNELWAPLSTETWAVASNMATDPDAFIALRAHCIQALMAAMWVKGEWQCVRSEAESLLQGQLHAFSTDIDRWLDTNGNHLQLAIAADLLTNSLELLNKPETGGDATKIEVKTILDMMCAKLDASDLPPELRARFANRAKVVEVFNIPDVAVDSNEPWTKLFKPVGVD